MSRRRALALLVLLAAVGVVVGVVVTSETPSKPRNADIATPSGAATVERRDLVATDTESGTLSYAGAHTVYDRLSGTITWLPSVGQLIKPGQALLDVAGSPVILMDGTTPAYRNLRASDSAGRDILQLNRNLVDLGFNPDGIVVDDAWQAATTAGVDLLQASLGETETGALSLGQIVFLPGDQLISTVDANLGSTGGASAAAAATASTPVPSGAPEFVSLATSSTTSPRAPAATSSTSTTPTTTTPTTTTPPSPAAGHPPTSSTSSPTLAQLTALLKAEAAQLKAATAALTAAKTPSSSSPQGTAPKKSSPSASSPSASKSPSGGGSSSPVLQTTSTALIVTVNLDASKQSEAAIGERVLIQMPAGNTVNGKITAISRIAQTPSSSTNSTSNTGATIPVTITLTGRHTHASLDQATVSVNFAQARAKNVLSVPVTALLATSGGGYAVQEADAPHTLIPVTTGLFAAGDVQISGPGIYQGLQVTDSQG
jgi:hypothetical protein